MPELSEDLCEINPWYNNIIQDDLMAEATDGSVVSRKPASKRKRYLIAAKHVSKGNIIGISAKMPSTLLSSAVLAIENKLELSVNACLIKTESAL